MNGQPLTAQALRRRFDLSALNFETSDQLEPWSLPFAQERAIEAIDMALRMNYHGYNLYLMGSQGLGKHRLVRQMIHQHSLLSQPLYDWCYIHNFDQAHRPKVLKLPQGLGAKLKKSMEQFVVEFVNQLNAQLNSPEFQRSLQDIKQKWVDLETEVFGEIGEEATARGFNLSKTDEGYSLVPEHQGEAMTEKTFQTLDESEQKRIESDTLSLKEALMNAMRSMADWEDQQASEIHQLEFGVFKALLEKLIKPLEKTYAGQLDVGFFLAQVKQDISQNLDDFKIPEEQKAELARLTSRQILETYPTYQVNVLVDNAHETQTPILYEEHPTFTNLMGRIEHTASMGALVTDFMHIKSGSLHRANGGYLILDTHRLLTHPYAWDALKRSLRGREVKMESPDQTVNLATTNTLEPEPMPLDIKVVLCGDRDSYFLLQEYDPEFTSLFKVMADFSESLYVPHQEAAVLANYVRMMAHLQHSEGLMALTRSAMECSLSYLARRMEDTAHLSLNRQEILDILREAHYWAQRRGAQVIDAEDLNRVEQSRELRHSRIQILDNEGFERGLTLVQTQGEVIGQVNALSVIDLGEMSYGHPSRVTATVYAGDSGITDIERESDMAGNIHTKGVMILTAWLSDRYAQQEALSMSANLAFEQNYGGVDGDSATLAEACALLSALAKLAVRQNLAITGSMNQLGQVQAVGGVNAKVESFYDLAQKRGLVPGQGVILPASNVQHLMLKASLVEAVEAGVFSIYPVETIDQAVELLLGRSMQEVDRLVKVRLQKWKNHKARLAKQKDSD